MNTLELRSYLQWYSSESTKIVVCAIDQLPRKLKKNCEYGFIINLSRINDIGTHWVALFINAKREGFYLDSYAFRPRSWYLTDFIEKQCKSISYNKQQLQQLTSKVCGMYAACFLIHMIEGYPAWLYLKKFSKNLVLNDSFIIKNYNYYLRKNQRNVP